jgi:hypothetical protein
MVETNEQLAALHAFPIDFVQGYLLGRPCSAIDTLRKNPLAGTIPCAFPPTAGGLDEKMAMIG